MSAPRYLRFGLLVLCMGTASAYAGTYTTGQPTSAGDGQASLVSNGPAHNVSYASRSIASLINPNAALSGSEPSYPGNKQGLTHCESWVQGPGQ